MSKTNIYILRCQNGKYYIGKSDNPMARYKEHLLGNGSAWTRLHKPVEVVKIIPNSDSFDEDKYTKECMAKYGIDNVRGGSYTLTDLSTAQKESIQKEIWGAEDKCTNCGKKGHFVNECYSKKNKTATFENKVVYNKSNACYRCGREGHYADECYARTSVKPKYGNKNLSYSFQNDDSEDDDSEDDDSEDDDSGDDYYSGSDDSYY